jgi:hypothetical protein
MSAGRAIAVCLVALAACGAEATPPGPATGLAMHHARRVGGALGEPVEVGTLLGLFTVPARIDGAEAVPMLVDTGAPLTFVASGAAGPRTLRSLGVGATVLYDVPVLGGDPFGLAPALGGVLGVNLICQFAATWDWQRRRFTLGDAPTDAETVGDEIVAPFTLRGGGSLATSSGAVAVPPTRILVDATIEDARRALILDTGASTSALRDDLVAALAAGRRSVGLRVAVQGGVVTQRIVRVATLSAFGITREAAPVVGYDRAGLDALGAEVGARVDGLLGADFFQGHLLTIDYPSGRVRMRRYRDTAHVRDRWTRAGVILGRRGTTWLIADVLAGTDAARAMVPVGAVLVAVDGRALEGITLDAGDALLQGAAGETRALQTDRGEFRVRVEDVILLQ